MSDRGVFRRRLQSLKCRFGIHDWEHLYFADRLGMEVGYSVHECTRCGVREERFTAFPMVGVFLDGT